MLLIYHIVIAWIYNITHRTEKAEAASLKWLLHNDQTHTHTNSTLTLLALSTLSRKGKKASELTETSLSLPTHSLFSASVNNSGTCSNSAFHLIDLPSAPCPPQPFRVSLPLGWGGQESGEQAGDGEGIECAPPPKDPACYMTVVWSVWNQPYQLFNAHNSVHIKDLLQQTEKQSTDAKETENAGSALKVTQYINCSCQ